MSGISLRGFVSTALKAEGSGNIRLAKGAGDQLVNKGTLGNRVASFFRAGAEAAGLAQADPTRAQRRQAAVTSFRQALTDRYGADAANSALGKTGLGQAGTARLTGKLVLAAVGHARAEWAKQVAANTAKREAFLPPEPGKAASPKFLQVAHAAGLRDLDQMGAPEKAEYAKRLKDLVLFETNLNRMPLTGPRAEALARQALREVSALVQAGRLDAACDARDASAAAMKDVYVGLAKGVDSAGLIDRLAGARAAIERQGAAEGVQAMGAQEIGEFSEGATRNAVLDLRAGGAFPLASKAQANALAAGSELRAIRFAADQIINSPNATVAQSEFAHRVGQTARDAVLNLSSMLGARTASVMNDADETGVAGTAPPPSAEQVARAKEALLAGANEAGIRDLIADHAGSGSDASKTSAQLAVTRRLATRPDAPGAREFLAFAEKRRVMDSVGFLRAVQEYRRLPEGPARDAKAAEIMRERIDPPDEDVGFDAEPLQVNLTGVVRNRLTQAAQQPGPLPANLFDEAEGAIALNLNHDVVFDFVAEMRQQHP